MDTRDYNLWPAQEPPADFAQRAVEAMLATERPARWGRVNRRWVVGLALAAALAAAGAWGMVEIRKAHGPKAPVVVPPPATLSAEGVALKPTPVVVGIAAPSVSQPIPSTTAPTATPPRPKPSASAPVPVPSASTPIPGKKIVAPRCECPPNEGFCTCVEY